MQVELPYGEGTVRATLPDRTRVLSTAPAAGPPAVEDLGLAVRAALAAPSGPDPVGDIEQPTAAMLGAPVGA